MRIINIYSTIFFFKNSDHIKILLFLVSLQFSLNVPLLKWLNSFLILKIFSVIFFGIILLIFLPAKINFGLYLIFLHLYVKCMDQHQYNVHQLNQVRT